MAWHFVGLFWQGVFAPLDPLTGTLLPTEKKVA